MTNQQIIAIGATEYFCRLRNIKMSDGKCCPC
jgi:hypothetical protein